MQRKGKLSRIDSLVWFHFTELTWKPGEGVQLNEQGSPGLTEASNNFTVSPPLAANNAIVGSRQFISHFFTISLYRSFRNHHHQTRNFPAKIQPQNPSANILKKLSGSEVKENGEHFTIWVWKPYKVREGLGRKKKI